MLSCHFMFWLVLHLFLYCDYANPNFLKAMSGRINKVLWIWIWIWNQKCRVRAQACTYTVFARIKGLIQLYCCFVLFFGHGQRRLLKSKSLEPPQSSFINLTQSQTYKQTDSRLGSCVAVVLLCEIICRKHHVAAHLWKSNWVCPLWSLLDVNYDVAEMQ